MFDDEQAHKKKMHKMNRSSQCVLCLLITSGFCTIPLQAGCGQRKHINNFFSLEGGRVWVLQTNGSNCIVIHALEAKDR